MEEKEVIIRKACPDDAERLVAIYSHYVENTAVSFEYVTPSVREFRSRIENTVRKYPYLVAESGGTIFGYAYAGPLGIRAAFAWSCEVSIYIDKNARRHGYGRKLYEALENELRQMGIRNLYASIASPVSEDPFLTGDSEIFHGRLGFRKCGEFHKCGFKFGRRYNLIWMEKFIGPDRTDGCPSSHGGRSYSA